MPNFSIKRHLIYSLGAIFMALETACTPLYSPDVVFPNTLPIDRPPPPKTSGSIYQVDYNMSLFSDRVAHRVGDVITVRLEEATKGEYSAKTKTQKKAQLNYSIPTFFGHTAPGGIFYTNSDQEFDTKGNSDQSNKLTGMISVTVIRVLSNHNLLVQGESWMTINQGQEFVQISGIVRPEDIAPNNSVSSQRIAGAQIKYGARGQAGYATAGGIVTKLFNRFAPY